MKHAAKDLTLTTFCLFNHYRKNVNEVMYEVGYTDVKAFREVFRKVTGLSPVEHKQRFSKS